MPSHLPASLMADLSKFIEQKMALYFPQNHWADLEQKIEPVSREFGFKDQEEFCRWLISSTISTAQTEILANHLTIPETYFWREPDVFAALEQTILPELIRSQENGAKRLRIWSAGCSSGEEAYSLAIVLKRGIPHIKNWDILILATDINPGILRKASAGVYGDWSFRNPPPWLKNQYFTRHINGKLEISCEIRNMVKFSYLNLADENLLTTANSTDFMDIIFCRNVLMYFSNERIKKIGEKLFQSLNQEGWLMVSAAELSMGFFPQFTAVHFPNAIVYKKSEQHKPDQATAAEEPSIEPVLIEHESTEAVEALEAPTNSELKPSESERTSKENVVESVEAIKLSTDEIRTLADQGRLNEAALYCEIAILEDRLDPQLYFLHATILLEQNQDLEAIVSLKKSLYLDPDFFMGHFTMGNLMLQRGKKQLARKHLKNALVILAKFHQKEVMQESEGLTAGRLREIVSATMLAGDLT